jgi:hypothetical protein
MARPQNMDEVKRQIEQVLVAHSAPLSHRNVSDVAPQPVAAVPGQAAIGEETSLEVSPAVSSVVLTTGASDPTGNAADRVTRACDTTATDIESAADVLLKVAKAIADESHQLAELLRKHGKLIASHIEDFTAMTQRVALKMREARADVLGSSENGIFKESAMVLNEAGSIRMEKQE